MATYSAAVLDDIRAGVDIVDFIGPFVNLRKAGANWKGLCPFHGEKTPSFMVNPKKGIFHCFGCGVGGDIFGFLMRQDRLSFPEAVRALAKTAGSPRAFMRRRCGSRPASARGSTSTSAASIRTLPSASASAQHPTPGTDCSTS